jgi:hypothetical protein
MTTEWEKDAAEFEEASREPYTPTDAYDGYAEYLASLPESLPTPEDFADVTPERRAAILEQLNGVDPFA